MVVFIASVSDFKYPFFGKLGPKNENCQFQLRFGASSIWNIKNSMVILLLLLFLDGSILFMADLFQKYKIVCWGEIWNLEYFEYIEFDGVFYFVLF